MIMVTLDCRECSTRGHGVPIEFASAFEPGSQDAIADTQAHIDTMFSARCGKCFACDWEVVDTRGVDIVSMMGR